MMFASHCGVTLKADALGAGTLEALFNEELGALLQVPADRLEEVMAAVKAEGLEAIFTVAGELNDADAFVVTENGREVLREARTDLMRAWCEVSNTIARNRDNPACADSETDWACDKDVKGLFVKTTFDNDERIAAPYIATGVRPKLAVLREQGVNSQTEMAAAFTRAGFEAYDVHMTDLLSGRVTLEDFVGMAVCGGFSYGDVLGAGGGWSKTILHNAMLSDMFSAFFNRTDTFALGICNGCQMMSRLKSLIPGAEAWPEFVRNRSEQFEARCVELRIEESPSIFFKGMAGSCMPIVNSHGEGRVQWYRPEDAQAAFVAMSTATASPPSAIP